MSLPQRKHPRLTDYDYSAGGAYYVTIHIRQNAPVLSTVVGRGLAPAACIHSETAHMRDDVGIVPYKCTNDSRPTGQELPDMDAALTTAPVGRGLAPAAHAPAAHVPDAALHDLALGEAKACLTEIGREAVRQLFALEKRIPFVHVANYVVMPTHIHLLLYFDEKAAGASPRPTLSSVIGAYKSLTTRRCNLLRNTPGKSLFQTSFYEHVVRNEVDFRQIWEYIDGNPGRWLERQL